MGFLVGLTTYTLYTLAASHANDRAKPHEMVAVSAGLLFIYCIGAIVAPPLASLLMRAYRPRRAVRPGGARPPRHGRLSRCGG